MNRYISIAAFSQAEKAAFKQDRPIKELLCPDGGEIEIVDMDLIKQIYPKRPVNAHKGTFGHLSLIVGSESYSGAAQIATLAALRSGVGIAELISVKDVIDAAGASVKEATFTALKANTHGRIAACRDNAEIISNKIKNSSAILFGCGIGNSDDALEILKLILSEAECPIIIDADGINALSKNIELLRTAKAEVILTPHIGELARLAKVTTDEAIERRCELATSISREYGCVVVAKSSSTIIADGKKLYLSAFGNDGLSKGGSGDMLAGLISSFAAQHIPIIDSAILGVASQGLACEGVCQEYSTRGVLASDIIGYLPLLFKKIERHEVN